MTKFFKFLPLLFISLLVVGGVWYLQVKALDSGALSPGTMADDATVGTVAWGNPNNAKVSDNVYATVVQSAWGDVVDKYVNIIKSDGTLGSTNKAKIVSWGTTDTYISYGSSSDLWGETWDSTKINNSNFGVAISVYGNTSGVITHYLKASNFGFSIPTGATINGILAEIEQKEVNSFATTGYVDHIRITVYYTVSVTVPLAPQQVIIKNASTIIKSASMTIKAR